MLSRLRVENSDNGFGKSGSGAGTLVPGITPGMRGINPEASDRRYRTVKVRESSVVLPIWSFAVIRRACFPRASWSSDWYET